MDACTHTPTECALLRQQTFIEHLFFVSYQRCMYHLAYKPVCASINKGKQSLPLVSCLIVLKESTSSHLLLQQASGNAAELSQLALRMWKTKRAKRHIKTQPLVIYSTGGGGGGITPIHINTRLKTQHQDEQTAKFPQQLKPNHLLPTWQLPHDYVGWSCPLSCMGMQSMEPGWTGAQIRSQWLWAHFNAWTQNDVCGVWS